MGKAKELAFDIETYPTRKQSVMERLYEQALSKRPAQNVKKELKLLWDTDAAAAERFNEAHAKTALDPLLAEVLCVCWQADGEVGGVDCMRHNEVDGLRAVAEAFEGLMGPDTLLVGHNICGFDIPVLLSAWHRHGVTPPAWWPRVVGGRVRGRVHDTMLHAPNGNGLGLVSLSAVCEAYGLLPAKSVEWAGFPMEGSRVKAAFEAGEYELLMTYCHADVEAEFGLYRAQTHDGAWGGSLGHAVVVEKLREIDASGVTPEQGKIMKFDVLLSAGYVPG